jgi:hypothetical protein
MIDENEEPTRIHIREGGNLIRSCMHACLSCDSVVSFEKSYLYFEVLKYCNLAMAFSMDLFSASREISKMLNNAKERLHSWHNKLG